jgi:hypothetical protein
MAPLSRSLRKMSISPLPSSAIRFVASTVVADVGGDFGFSHGFASVGSGVDADGRKGGVGVGEVVHHHDLVDDVAQAELVDHGEGHGVAAVA